jgi:ABC-2 type transport system permease protein
MNTQSNGMPESSFEPLAAAPAAFSATQPLYWAVRREFWENRSIYVAPLAVAALIVLASVLGAYRLPYHVRAASGLDPLHQQEAMQEPYMLAALLLMLSTFVVAIFYCLDALHGERRDRSILFWKSLPVSDLQTVLSKASVPLVILPLLTFAITVVTQFIMLTVSSVVVLANGLSLTALWRQVSFFQMSLVLLYHLVAVHALAYAPIYGWLLLVSAWARRLPFLWALLPLVAIGIVEKMAFNTSHFAGMLMNQMSGGATGADISQGSLAMDPLMHITPGRFLVSPGLWIGLTVFAAFLAVAVRLRRSQGPM